MYSYRDNFIFVIFQASKNNAFKFFFKIALILIIKIKLYIPSFTTIHKFIVATNYKVIITNN